MKPVRLCLLITIVAAGLASTDCMSWKPPPDPAVYPEPTAPTATTRLLEQARELTAVAGGAESLQKTIDAYEAVLAEDPTHTEARVAVADRSILLATAYTEGRKAKRRLYRRAREYSELAMYGNSEFRSRIEGGQRPWEACEALGGEHMGAMVAWMTALLYEFKECMSAPSKILNIRWISRLKPFLERMEEIDPSFEDGVVPFNWGFYYFVLPGSLGGDKDRAAEEFERAVEMGVDRVVYRWGRARFFRVRIKDRDGFREDLEWVISRDPRTVTDPPYWVPFVQRDARQAVDDIDRYF